MRTAGNVLDMYDDNGALLPSLLPAEDIPEFVKEAAPITPELADRLSNEAFALAAKDGDHVIRKYAMVDPAHVWLHTQYFLAQREQMPKLAQAQVTSRLLAAHDHYGMTMPEELVKTAMALRDVPAEKTAAALVDLSAEPTPVRVEQEKVAEEDLVLGKYPIRTHDEIKLASEFFDENCLRLHPRERRDFAVKLAGRAGGLGVRVSPVVEKYASDEQAADAKEYIALRKQYLPQEQHDHLDKLAGALDYEPAEKVAEALCLLDEHTQLNHLWDKHVVDPFYSVLGHVKTAEDDVVWAEGNDRVTKNELEQLAANDKGALMSKFGETFVMDFIKNPVSVFKSMPDPVKLVLARMANDLPGFAPKHG